MHGGAQKVCARSLGRRLFCEEPGGANPGATPRSLNPDPHPAHLRLPTPQAALRGPAWRPWRRCFVPPWSAWTSQARCACCAAPACRSRARGDPCSTARRGGATAARPSATATAPARSWPGSSQASASRFRDRHVARAGSRGCCAGSMRTLPARLCQELAEPRRLVFGHEGCSLGLRRQHTRHPFFTLPLSHRLLACRRAGFLARVFGPGPGWTRRRGGSCC